MRLIFIIFIIATLLQSCLVSRTQRPILSGYVYDASSKKPLANCKVGETYTDASGHYELEEIRTRKLTFTLMESRPLFIGEIIQKQGYLSDTITRFHKDGGGFAKRVCLSMDTIYLIKQH